MMLLLISGPSAIGKDSMWVRAAEGRGFKREVPYTTREPRPGEVPGVDYLYLTRAEFQDRVRKGLFADWDYTLGHYYGSDALLLERVARGERVVMQVLARMGLRLRTRIRESRTILLTASSSEVILQRLVERGYVGDERARRAAHCADEQVHAPLFDFVVPDADIVTSDEAAGMLEDMLAGIAEPVGR